MPRRRNRRRDSGLDIGRGIGLVLILGGSSLVGWWQQQPAEGQLFLAVAMLVTISSGIGLIVLLQVYVQRRRKLAWQRAMASWRSSQPNGRQHTQLSSAHLSPHELEHFAARVYAKMGYRVAHTGRSGDHGVDVKLIRPDGQIELVQCKQWNKPVGEPEVRDLYGAMAHDRAVRGFIWAPHGFTAAAHRWAKGKPIVLADNREIDRLVQSAFNI